MEGKEVRNDARQAQKIGGGGGGLENDALLSMTPGLELRKGLAQDRKQRTFVSLGQELT